MPNCVLFKIYSGIIFHVSFPGDISLFNQEIFRESRNSLKFSIFRPFVSLIIRKAYIPGKGANVVCFELEKCVKL